MNIQESLEILKRYTFDFDHFKDAYRLLNKWIDNNEIDKLIEYQENEKIMEWLGSLAFCLNRLGIGKIDNEDILIAIITFKEYVDSLKVIQKMNV